MKKYILSSFVILTFIIYAIYERFGTSGETGVVAPPKSASATQSTNPLLLSNTQKTNLYKDGDYVGDVTDAYYGYIQVKALIKNSKITDVQFLKYPNDRRNSISINTQAMPYLKEEAIQAQDANVDIVSGATQTSLAFKQSLQSALLKAK